MKTSAILLALAGSSASAFAFMPSVATTTMKMTTGTKNEGMSRREALTTAGAGVLASGIAFGGVLATAAPAYADGPYFVPDLPYGYDALEPAIDAATMKFHHDKHHAAYVANSNKYIAGKDAVPILELQKDAIKNGNKNAVGGHYNHCLFWQTLAPVAKSGKPSASLQKAIDAAFGSTDAMKEKFGATAAGVFGSGWAWLGVKDGKLEITSTPNQDNPLMDGQGCTAMIPILGLDVWEHAYYLKYQNRRPEYIAAFWSVVNWDKVSEYFDKYGMKGEGVPLEG